MFGNIGQLAHLMRNAGQIKENMARMQERLEHARFAADAGAGQVTATVDGKGELVSIKIDPALAAGGDLEMLEDLVVAATRAAVAQSRIAMKKELEAAAGGLDLGGLLNMIK
jgi:hypothetical protein